MRQFKLIFILSLLSLFSCKQITWLSTEKGGCNDLKQGQIETKRNLTEKPDTVYYSISHEILTLHAGINHICCTPFTTKTSIDGNQIIMELIDTCPAPDFNCYCRCMCYYTFDFNFKDFTLKEYKYKLYLKEARAEKNKLLKEGVVNIKSLGLR